MIRDASFLINLSHVKGHPSCSFGATFKNLAPGCMIGETRGASPCWCYRCWLGIIRDHPAVRNR